MQARDNLTDAPVPYLKNLHRGVMAMAMLGVANGLVQATWVYFRHPVVAWMLLLGGAAWAAAVWIPTGRRPFQPGMRINPEREKLRLRQAARLSQLAWPARGLFLVLMLEAGTAASAGVLRIPAAALQFVGVLGFAPLCIWLAHLADWAQDTGLSGRLRLSAVLVGAGGVVMTLAMTATVLASGTGFAAPLSILAGLSLLGYEIGLLVFVISQLQFAGMVGWAVRNAKAAIVRDQRVLERKARRTFSGDAAAGTPLAEMARRRGEAVLDPCARMRVRPHRAPAGFTLPGVRARAGRRVHRVPPPPEAGESADAGGSKTSRWLAMRTTSRRIRRSRMGARHRAVTSGGLARTAGRWTLVVAFAGCALSRRRGRRGFGFGLALCAGDGALDRGVGQVGDAEFGDDEGRQVVAGAVKEHGPEQDFLHDDVGVAGVDGVYVHAAGEDAVVPCSAATFCTAAWTAW
ncbi:MAG: hypothetical protein HND58_11190 [Planctomycetota bacterium]|nr:MAG: hypothetical protein HND58_11190 [Planctomycetota bacterium]